MCHLKQCHRPLADDGDSAPSGSCCVCHLQVLCRQSPSARAASEACYRYCLLLLTVLDWDLLPLLLQVEMFYGDALLNTDESAALLNIMNKCCKPPYDFPDLCEVM
jgi:hypothetical protein